MTNIEQGATAEKKLSNVYQTRLIYNGYLKKTKLSLH